MTGGLRYRNFRQELSSVAGYHTGDKLVLDEVYMDDASVAVHEQIHGRIFDETPDGMLHRSVMLCLQEDVHPNHRDSIISLNEYLFEDTRVAHERAATFLGVISLPTRSEMVKAAKRLDSEYKEYFTYFSEFLPWENSSFISFLIANTITGFAFSSERLNMLSDAGSLTTSNLQAIKGPCYRMDAAKRVFADGKLEKLPEMIQSLFEPVMVDNYIEPFDLFDDSSWMSRMLSGSVDNSVIERIGAEVLEALISMQAGLSLSYRLEIPECFKDVFDFIKMRNFNVEFPFVGGEFEIPEDPAHFIAEEADRNCISRRSYMEFPEFQVEFALNQIASYIEHDLCLIFVQVSGHAEQFKSFATVINEGESSFVPGTGLVLNIHEISRFTTYLARIVVQLKISSPLYYMVYAPGAPDHRGTPICVPQYNENIKMFTNHLIAEGQPAEGQGLLVRPVIYARPFWSRAIKDTVGVHTDYSVKMINEDDGGKCEYNAQIMFSTETSMPPVVSIMNNISRASYSNLLKHQVSKGRLELKKGGNIDRGLSESLFAIWETLPNI